MIGEVAEHANEVFVLDSAFLDPNLPSKRSVNVVVTGDPELSDLDPVLVILNHNLPRLTAALWRRARLVVVADGGADQLLEASRGWEEEGDGSAGRRRRADDDKDGRDGDDGSGGETPPLPAPRFLPDAIVGDLDSISAKARAHYESLGVRIVDLAGDQDCTDLQKCLEFAAGEVEKLQSSAAATAAAYPSSFLPVPPPPPVFVAGALGGRLDHSLSAISTLYAIDAARAARRRKEKKKGEEEEEEEEEREGEREEFADAVARSLGEVVLCGAGSLARLVPSSRSPSSGSSGATTKILPCPRVEGPGCGLVALGAPATDVGTSGLKWDLRGGEKSRALEMGGLQSTSNSIEAAEVTVTTGGGALLWTTTLKEEWS